MRFRDLGKAIKDPVRGTQLGVTLFNHDADYEKMTFNMA
jgi:hypothetical protein